jgi:hypothetical protein
VDPHWFQMRIWVQLFISMRIRIRNRIQGAKPMRIQTDPDLDADQAFESEKVEFLHDKLVKHTGT